MHLVPDCGTPQNAAQIDTPDPGLAAWAKRINDHAAQSNGPLLRWQRVQLVQEMPPLTPAQKARLRMLLTPVREALHREAA